MISRKSTLATVFLAFASKVLAQSGIPDAFTRGFDPTGTTELQVAFDSFGDVQDGEDVTGKDASKVPQFSLGDSSGVNTNARFIVLMIDPDVNGNSNTPAPQRLHYLRTDFAPGSDTGVQINSDKPPAVKYVGPEATTDNGGVPVHRYVFLLYSQPRNFELKGVDGDQRDGFDVAKWREQNGLKPAVAGLHVIATVGGGGGGGGQTTVATETTALQTSAVQTSNVYATSVGGITATAVAPPPPVDTSVVAPPPANTPGNVKYVTVTEPCACTQPVHGGNPIDGTTTIAQTQTAVVGGAVATHTVIVGGTGSSALVYTPEFLTANPGDVVHFDFRQRNHTVTQSTLDLPCKLKADGVRSGFRPNPEGTPGKELFEYVVPDANPKWFFCGQADHCQKGMVFAINPKDKFQQFKANAGGNSTASGTGVGGVAQPTGGVVGQEPFRGAGSALRLPTTILGLVVAGAVAVIV